MRSLKQLLRRFRPDPDRHAPDLGRHPFDRAYGTDTGGLIPPDRLLTPHPHSPHTSAYYAMSPSRLHAAIHLWQCSPPRHPIGQTTFIDLGCGKGRAILLASDLPFEQIRGVELHPNLARIARRNLARWQASHPNARPTVILQADAAEILLPRTPTLLYLFHPFSEAVTRRLLEVIRGQTPVALDILYFNPEAADLWLAQPEVSLLWREALPMSPADAAADPVANPDDLCDAYRWTPA